MKKTDTKKLIQMLELTNGCNSHTWDMVRKLVKSIENGESIVKKHKMFDEFLKYTKTDFSKLDTWSTYDNNGGEFYSCINLHFEVVDKKLKCHAKIYNGYNMDGSRTTKRFEVDLELNNSFLEHLEGNINGAFNKYIENQYENYLQSQRQLWIDDMKKKLLAEL